MIKRYHEAPLSIFNKVQELTDGDYALVHLFESNPKYLKVFQQAIADGRDVLLDNSVFELGTAFDGDKFAEWVEQLKPTWYIVPDSWKNCIETVKMFKDFVAKHPDLPGKRIGVAQGYTVNEVAKCYKALEPHCDMIAFNLDFSFVFYESFLPNVDQLPKKYLIPYCVAMSLGRHMVLSKLMSKGVINVDKPHHLLGCGVPQEVLWYPKEWTWIRSIDTSNPVIAGMNSWLYHNLYGITKKDSMKLCDHVNDKVSSVNLAKIIHNISVMKEWCTTWRE